VLVSSRRAFVVEAQVAAGSGGEAVAVWNQVIGKGGSTLVVSTRRSLGGGWSRPRRLWGLPRDETAFDPQVAVAPSGAAVIAWQSETTNAIEAVSRASASRPWTAPKAIADGELGALGIDDRGHAVLVYSGGSRWQRIEAVRLVARDGTWSRPHILAASRQAPSDPTVAVNATGQAVAAWSSVRHPGGEVCQRCPASYGRYTSWVEAAVLRAGRWSAARRLGTETQYFFDLNFDSTPNGPEVAIDRRGRAIAVWQRNPRRDRLILDAATLDAGKTRWRATRSPVPVDAPGFQVVSNPAGWVTLAWETGHGGISTRAGPITGCCWSHTTTFPAGHNTGDFDLNLISGPKHAAALDFARAREPVQLVIRPAAGARWSKPIAIGHDPGYKSNDPYPLALAASPTGQLLTIWTREGLNAPLYATSATEH
jgi:hypothetical protein